MFESCFKQETGEYEELVCTRTLKWRDFPRTLKLIEEAQELLQ